MAADIRVALSPTIGDYDSMMISRFTGETTQVLNAAIPPPPINEVFAALTIESNWPL